MALKMLVFFVVASFVAWPLLIIGLQQRRESRERNEIEHTRTTGVIVDYVRGTFRTGRGGVSTYWKPVVEFTAEGQKVRAEYENRMDQEQFPVGKAVEILYDVSDPTRFHLEEDPVFISGGAGAIRYALIWIIGSAVLTVLLAVFVGGLSVDFRYLGHRIQWFIHRHR